MTTLIIWAVVVLLLWFAAGAGPAVLIGKCIRHGHGPAAPVHPDDMPGTQLYDWDTDEKFAEIIKEF